MALGVLASMISTITGASYALYTVAVQESRKWSLLALALTEVGVAVSFALITKNTSNPDRRRLRVRLRHARVSIGYLM